MDTTIRLTSRETDVLQLLAAGHTYTQVSERLGVSSNTVASHVKNIYRKLEVHSGRAAVWRALELRLLGAAEVEPSPFLAGEGSG
jgi:DNA-binding NarL/FixJ family response regulator